MAVTRINGASRLAQKSVVEALINDGAVSTRTIADKAVTAGKIDSSDNYAMNQLALTDTLTVASTAEVDGNTTLKGNLSAEQDASVGGKLSVTGDANVGGNVVISGNLQVDGDQVINNTSIMEVEDKNITINKGGNTDSMTGSGLTVDNTDTNGNKGSLVYDANVTSLWKIGDEGTEVEVAIISGAQTLTDKTYMLTGGVIENKNNIEDALRALDDKVNNGTAYKVQEGDITSSNYDNDDSSENHHATWAVGEGIHNDSPVHVYVSGVRLRSGVEDSSGNISNDYAIDYTNGKVLFAEKPDGNIVVEYIAA
jgi:cytoskeletal protein CcmA (bactofilin family)